MHRRKGFPRGDEEIRGRDCLQLSKKQALENIVATLRLEKEKRKDINITCYSTKLQEQPHSECQLRGVVLVLRFEKGVQAVDKQQKRAQLMSTHPRVLSPPAARRNGLSRTPSNMCRPQPCSAGTDTKNNLNAGAPIRRGSSSFRLCNDVPPRRKHCGVPKRGGGYVRRQARGSSRSAVRLQLLRRQRGEQGLAVGRVVPSGSHGTCERFPVFRFCG